MVAYHDCNTPMDMLLSFYDANGTFVAAYNAGNTNWSQESTCPTDPTLLHVVPKCGGAGSSDCGGTGCSGFTQDVQVSAVETSSNTCYAYMAYDSKCLIDAGDGVAHIKSNLQVLDITNESAIALKASYISSSCLTSASNEFMGTTTASTYIRGNVGWFYYQEPVGSNGHTDPCHTVFVGQTSTSFGLSSLSNPIEISQAAGAAPGTIGSFPMNRFPSPSGGPGDYIGIIKSGIPGGYLFPTWSQGLVTSASCPNLPSCTVDGASHTYNMSIWGAEVMP
jgi:hypothetical protein